MSSTRTGPVSLPDTLRDCSDDQLAALLRLRPDLVTPLPSDLDQLASRALTRSSLLRLVDRLDRFELAVVEAGVVLAEAEAGVVSRAGLAALLGVPDDRLQPTLQTLRDAAMMWGPDEDLACPRVVADIVGPYPAGLGPASDTPLDAAKIEALLDGAGAEARTLAERLAAGPPLGRLGDAQRGSVGQVVTGMLASGLLVRVDVSTVALPREVGLHLRGGRLLPPGQLDPPELTGRTQSGSLVDQAAAGTALEVVRRIEQLLEDWGQAGPAVLKAGGLGVRDLRRVASRLDVDEQTAALYVETAYAAGLIGQGDGDPVGPWLPSEGYDRWRLLPPESRWAELAHAWLTSSRVAGLVGSRDDRDKLRAALSAETGRSAAREFRKLVLHVYAEAPEGTVLDAETVLARLRWERPRRANDFVADFVGWTVTEAAALGVTGLGALTTPGRALTSEASREVAAALAPLLPEPVDHVLLQADLTAVAPGPLRHDLARSLAQMADAESHGGATVYRFTPESIRRALDAGRTASDVHTLLSTHSRTPVPQPLSYLVDDVARRHGQLRAGPAGAYLRCDDETLVESVIADRRTADLGLRQIAPTVLISRTPVRALVEELRKLGYAPVPESADGALVLTTPQSDRAPERRQQPVASGPRTPEPPMLAAAVRALRAGDRARSARPDQSASFVVGRTASAEAVRLLRAAIDDHVTVWIGYADQHGSTTERVVDPVRIDAGALTAYDHATGESRSYLLHRITGIARIE